MKILPALAAALCIASLAWGAGITVDVVAVGY